MKKLHINQPNRKAFALFSQTFCVEVKTEKSRIIIICEIGLQFNENFIA